MTQRINGLNPSSSRGLQTVFRVRGTKAREKPASSQDGSQKSTFSARKSHKKSRTGCQNCKSRRVKCDENRVGGCLKCRSHGIDCDYLDSNGSSPTATPNNDSSLKLSPFTFSEPSSASMTPTSTELAVLFPSLDPPTPLKFSLPSDITSYWETLRHFEIFTCPTITSPDGKRIFETSVLAIANQSDYLMHAVLGTAAAHLAWKANISESPIQLRRHQQAEAYHWQRALGMFRSRLDSIGQRSDETVDALISTCMLLGIHSYLLSGNQLEPSFVHVPESQRSNALRWLSLQSGFGLLLRSLGGRAALSVWLDVFNTAARGVTGFLQDFAAARGIFRDFLVICQIDEYSTTSNNPYFSAVQDLFTFLQMGAPTLANFAPLMAFMGRLVGPFQELLIKLDPAAMLVVAYWLALMRRLNLWWIDERARRECNAIINYLQGYKDPCIQRLLEFPTTFMETDPITTSLTIMDYPADNMLVERLVVEDG